MRIGVVHVTTEEASGPYTDLVTGTLDRAKGEGTEVLHRYVKHVRRAKDTALAYPTLLNKVDVIAEMVSFEKDGVDAVMVACSGDTGVAEAQSLLSIPVVGPMEASMLLACNYGRRFGILTVADRSWAGYMNDAVLTHGLTDRYVGLRQIETPTMVVFTEGFHHPETVGGDIRARADELIAMGAEVIVVGSAGLSTFATHCGIWKVEEPEVPIFDVLSVGLKVAELRAGMSRHLELPPVSRAGWTARFSEEDRQRVDSLFGWTEHAHAN